MIKKIWRQPLRILTPEASGEAISSCFLSCCPDASGLFQHPLVSKKNICRWFPGIYPAVLREGSGVKNKTTSSQPSSPPNYFPHPSPKQNKFLSEKRSHQFLFALRLLLFEIKLLQAYCRFEHYCGVLCQSLM